LLGIMMEDVPQLVDRLFIGNNNNNRISTAAFLNLTLAICGILYKVAEA
jgi:hypothetical protein